MTQLSNISEYTTDIRRITGKDNVVADTLSRAPVEDGPTLSPTLDIPNVSSMTSAAAVSRVDFDEIMREQQNDESLEAIQNDPSTGLRLIEVPQGDLTHLCDESTGKLRPFVLAALGRRVYEVVHNLAHPGVKATKKLVTVRVAEDGSQSAKMGTSMRTLSSVEDTSTH